MVGGKETTVAAVEGNKAHSLFVWKLMHIGTHTQTTKMRMAITESILSIRVRVCACENVMRYVNKLTKGEKREQRLPLRGSKEHIDIRIRHNRRGAKGCNLCSTVYVQC